MRPRESNTPGSFGPRPLPLLSQSAPRRSTIAAPGRQGRARQPQCRPAECPDPRPAPAAHNPRPRCGGWRSGPTVPRCGIVRFSIIHLTGVWQPQETRGFPPFCAVIVMPSACCAAVIRAWRVVRAVLCCNAAAYQPTPDEARLAARHGTLAASLGHFLRVLAIAPPVPAPYGIRRLKPFSVLLCARS